MNDYTVHALALAGFFTCAFGKELFHVPKEGWHLHRLKEILHQSSGETFYLFVVHLVVYSGLIVPSH